LGSVVGMAPWSSRTWLRWAQASVRKIAVRRGGVPCSGRVEQQRPDLVDDVVEKSSEGADAAATSTEGKKGRALLVLAREKKKGGFQLASQAHVGAELEAMAWSVTLTQMHRNWVAAGWLTSRAGKESKGV
jgi:hypothetical protein